LGEIGRAPRTANVPWESGATRALLRPRNEEEEVPGFLEVAAMTMSAAHGIINVEPLPSLGAVLLTSAFPPSARGLFLTRSDHRPEKQVTPLTASRRSHCLVR
jgi:hypothetical protein